MSKRNRWFVEDLFYSKPRSERSRAEIRAQLEKDIAAYLASGRRIHIIKVQASQHVRN